MQEIQEIIELIDKSIKEDPNNLITWGHIIEDWFDEEVDEYRKVIDHSKDWLLNYQIELQKQTSISNLKIKYTWASGYFIEVSKINISKVPDDFIHRQTLVNASRFSTVKLKEFEHKLLEWESLLFDKEYKLFFEIREKILDKFPEIKELSQKTAFMDFETSMAKVAYENSYSKPEISENNILDINWWRHPVIEQNGEDFIENDLELSKKDFVHIITWPNMWWKSTFLRQNALIVLLTHIWSFVPAKQAKIPMVDKIFSRVWAQDNLYLWQSTFMVEMQEVANILNNSTENSFVIIDEVWRWTSTYDGMSLAWAILKHNHDKIKAKTLFATHYHELTDKSSSLKWVSNYSVAVWENEENLIFLRKIIPWAIKKSYWIEVARIAGLWNEVIKEAKKMLMELEIEHNKRSTNQLSLLNLDLPEEKSENKEKNKDMQMIRDEIKSIDINNLTPISALNKINEIRSRIEKE